MVEQISQYFTCTNHLSSGFSQLFNEGLPSKSLRVNQTSADWLLYRDVACHGFVVMHAVSRFLRIFMRAEKQAYKQLQCYKAKLLEPASIDGLYSPKV